MKFWISSLVFLTGCNTIPNIKFYKEIPFIDAPEAVYIESAKRTRGHVNAQEWAELRPTMICLDPEGVSEVKLNWKKQCRVKGDECNVKLETVGEILNELDQVGSKVMSTKP